MSRLRDDVKELLENGAGGTPALGVPEPDRRQDHAKADQHQNADECEQQRLSSADSTQADCVDGEHQPTDLAVGGSNPSRRTICAG